ncbi:MAG: hypothetical protein NTZ93_00205 [Candidatus Beckwithbacteria bacterium]|nr:hypothetical protein [Candidatus Beckwithbacteria bacterium]
MTLPSEFSPQTDNNPLTSLEPRRKAGESYLGRNDIARLLDTASDTYEFERFIPSTVEPGLNFCSTIAIIHAIDHKGQTQGWEDQDLQLILPATLAALTTAGFANGRTSLEALLTGATGKLDAIMKTILPEKAWKPLKVITGAIVAGNQVDNIGKVASVLIDEKRVEKRLFQLSKFQRNILLDPEKTRALMDLLNLQNGQDLLPTLTRLPQSTEAILAKISPFSLKDMKATTQLFNAIEQHTDSRLQIDTHNLWIKTEVEKLLAAGEQLGQMGGNLTAATTKAILRGSGHIIGGGIGGLMELGDEMIWQIREAIEAIKERNEKRKERVKTTKLFSTSSPAH